MKVDMRRCIQLSVAAALVVVAVFAIWQGARVLVAYSALGGAGLGALLGARREPDTDGWTIRRKRILDTSIGGMLMGAGSVSVLFFAAQPIIRHTLEQIKTAPGTDVLVSHQLMSQLAPIVVDDALRAQRARVIPILIDQLGDTNRTPQERAIAAYRLAEFHDDADAIVPSLIAALGGDDAPVPVRIAIAYALGSFGPAAKDAVPELIEEMSDEGLPIRLRLISVDAVGKIGPAARGALPAVEKLADAIENPGNSLDRYVSEQEIAMTKATLVKIAAIH